MKEAVGHFRQLLPGSTAAGGDGAFGGKASSGGGGLGAGAEEEENERQLLITESIDFVLGLEEDAVFAKN